MRIHRLLAAALLVVTTACGGADASAGEAAGGTASTEQVRALVAQFALGGGDKDEAGAEFYDLAQRAVPGLVEMVNDPATDVGELGTILFIASIYVPDPAVLQALRARAGALPDRADREDLTKMMNALAGTPALPYPR
jgi:hypothetical protein